MVEVELLASVAGASPTGWQSACQFPKCSIAFWKLAALPLCFIWFCECLAKTVTNFFFSWGGGIEAGGPPVSPPVDVPIPSTPCVRLAF